MRKILVIAGPTATGKTSLAIEVTKDIPSILISADSRQVYKHMDVVTGKDHPKNINIAGIDLVNPEKSFSVASWNQAVSPVLAQAETEDLLPILIGGTGLYIKSIIEGISTINIPPDTKLRESLAQLNIRELQSQLKHLSPGRLTKMNNSDINNSRRLIRAIEISLSPKFSTISPEFDSLFIGLKTSLPILKERIHTRVLSRLADNSAIKETKYLLDHYDISSQSLSSFGYKPIIKYIKGKISKQKLIKSWTQSEFAYAKSQLTWFKKQENIVWFDAGSPGLISQVVKHVKNWYHKK